MKFGLTGMLAVAALSLVLSGCGQKSQTRNNTVVSPAPIASASYGRHHRRGQNAVPAGSLAPAPVSLNCGNSTPVWVNTRTHVYHVQGDPYYGRTVHGKYECENQAQQEGDRRSGAVRTQ